MILSVEIYLGFLALSLASYSNMKQHGLAQKSIGNEVEINRMFSRRITTDEIVDSGFQKRVMSYFVKDKQIGKTKFNNIMIENNKAILIKANAAITDGDYERFLSYCTDDTHWTFVGDETLQGKEAVRKYMAEAYLEPPKFEVDNLIAEGEFVTAVGKISLKDKDGKTTSYLYCDVWRFRKSKMAELKAFVVEMK